MAVFFVFYVDPSQVYGSFSFKPAKWYPEFDYYYHPGRILPITAHYIIISIFGYLAFIKFFQNIDTSIINKLVASFGIGFILTLGLLRIVTLFFGHSSFYFITIAIILLYITLKGTPLVKKDIQSFFSFKPIDLKATNLQSILLLAFYLLMVFGLMVYFMKYMDFSYGGHTKSEYEYYLQALWTSELSNFPVIPQHYSELLFHYFLSAIQDKSESTYLMWWSTLAICKTSLFALIFCIFKKFKLDTWISIIGTVFMFFGSNACHPLKYILLFDAANPLFVVATPGRVIGYVLTFIFIATVCTESSKEKSFSIPFLILAAIGLSISSISNSVLCLAFYLLVICIKYLYENNDLRARIIYSQSLHFILIITIFFGISLSYFIVNFSTFSEEKILYHFKLIIGITSVPGVHLIIALFKIFAPGTPMIIALVFSFIFLLFFVVLLCIRLKKSGFDTTYSKQTKEFLYFLGASVFSLLLLGNVTLNSFLSKIFIDGINKLNPFCQVSIYNPFLRNVKYTGTDVIRFFYDNRLVAAYSSFCKGFAHFIAAYGIYFIVILLIFLIYSKYFRGNGFHAEEKKEVDVLYFTFLCTICFLPFLFFFMDFIYINDTRAWIRTRFIEIPYYVTFLIFFYSIGKAKLKRIYIVLAIVVLFYSILPFWGTKQHIQWIDNFRLLIEHL